MDKIQDVFTIFILPNKVRLLSKSLLPLDLINYPSYSLKRYTPMTLAYNQSSVSISNNNGTLTTTLINY